ncbi:hypothetical protein ACBR40_05575 [Nonomuraea sp. AD125B]|uniref:hypothetical protein n=1 Tax=Nonomuraea sp. AD125B TaxID=3242897 RepID=UPI003526D699
MNIFSERELAYPRGERLLGRLATVGADGMPHVVPVSWSLDETVVPDWAARDCRAGVFLPGRG